MAHPVICAVEGTPARPALAPVGELVGDWSDREPRYTFGEAVAEAKRCATSSPCLYCEVCQLLCPDLAIVRDAGTGQVLIDLNFCKGCGLCAHYCPHGAILMVIDE